MRKLCYAVALAAAFAAGYFVADRQETSAAGDKKGAPVKGKIGHMVYFTLKDNSPAAKQKLVAACNKYLSKHDGEVYYAAGVLAESLDRKVNVRDWDVALHLVFKDLAAHDRYQDAKRHIEFIEENKDNWKSVRVFDSVID